MRFTPWGHAARRAASIKRRSAADRKQVAPPPCGRAALGMAPRPEAFFFPCQRCPLAGASLAPVVSPAKRAAPTVRCRLAGPCLQPARDKRAAMAKSAARSRARSKRATIAVLPPTTGPGGGEGGRSPAGASENWVGGGASLPATRRRHVSSSVSATHLFSIFCFVFSF